MISTLVSTETKGFVLIEVGFYLALFCCFFEKEIGGFHRLRGREKWKFNLGPLVSPSHSHDLIEIVRLENYGGGGFRISEHPGCKDQGHEYDTIIISVAVFTGRNKTIDKAHANGKKIWFNYQWLRNVVMYITYRIRTVKNVFSGPWLTELTQTRYMGEVTGKGDAVSYVAPRIGGWNKKT